MSDQNERASKGENDPPKNHPGSQDAPREEAGTNPIGAVGELGAEAMSAVQTAGVGVAISVLEDLASGRPVDAKRAVLQGASGAGRSVVEAGVRAAMEEALRRKAPEFLLREAAAEGVRRTARAAGRAVLRGNVIGHAAALVVDQAIDTAAVFRGEIDKGEYAVRTGANVAGGIGSLTGLGAGAAIGTAIFPGVGTAIGAFVGGWLGGAGVRAAVHRLFR